MPPLALIVAYNKTRTIGIKGTLPWNLPEDMKRFRDLTMGHAVIMGRNTWESIPAKQRPLKGRHNIVVSSRLSLDPPSLTAPSLETALVEAYAKDACPFIIGGAQLYRAALPLATVMYVTEVDNGVLGDVFFPEFVETDWLVMERVKGPLCSFVRYHRKENDGYQLPVEERR